MKRSILIILGVVLILSIVGIWVYLFVYGTPERVGDVFGQFGDTPESAFPQSDPAKEGGAVSPKGEALRQLTTRPVAGAVIVQNAVRYVERGTGHVYDVPLKGGEEKLVSNTTIPQTVTASFSPDGARIVMSAQRNEHNETIVASLTGGDLPHSLEGISLPAGVTNIAWNSAGNGVQYLLPNSSGSTGYLYDPLTETSSDLFTIPLRDVRVVWGEPTYVYTTPTARQTGYVYRADKTGLHYLTGGRNGLMAVPYEKGVIVSGITDSGVASFRITDGQTLPLSVFPEKCVAIPHTESSLYCAGMLRPPQGEYPDDWYKGVLSFSDTLWLVNVDTAESRIVSALEESGREIDVSEIGTDETGSYIYFVNKNDGSLWLFDTTI